MRFLMNFLLVVLLVAVLAVWVMLPWPGAALLAVLIAAWLLLTRRGRQAASVANVGISTLPQRLGSSASSMASTNTAIYTCRRSSGRGRREQSLLSGRISMRRHLQKHGPRARPHRSSRRSA